MVRYSIILPVKNGGALLKECVKSILQQTYVDFELIVLDNASTDGTLAYLNSIEDKRIKIIPSATSLGIVENWGRIKDIQKGTFITLIGHDDVLLENYLEEMDKLIEKFPYASLYQSHFKFINAASEITGDCKPMLEEEHVDSFLQKQFTNSIDSMGTGYMMRSRDFDNLGGMPQQYPNLIFADYQLWMQLTSLSYKATSAECCFYYRVHKSTSTLTNGQQYQEAFLKYGEFLNQFQSENEPIRKTIEKNFYDFLIYHCESLSHRILKTPIVLRTIKVGNFVKACKILAQQLIPNISFQPEKKLKIWAAIQLDKNAISRNIFQQIRKLLP